MAHPTLSIVSAARIHGLMGPAILITIGVLFLIQHSSGDLDSGTRGR